MDDFNFSLMWANKQCEYASFLHIVFHNQQQNASSLDSYVFLISVLLLFLQLLTTKIIIAFYLQNYSVISEMVK